MMSFYDRDELKPDAVIMLNNKPCRIINILGSGTSSIVYRAKVPICIDGLTCDRTVVLKELYPRGLDIGRKDDLSLYIPEISLMDFRHYTNRFQKACKRQIDFHNNEKTTNVTTDLQDVYEANNTLYSVQGIVTGSSYDTDQCETITSILNVGMCLTDCISKYHKMGYLHLDIKPENIFKSALTGDNIALQLFDFDTVSTKEEILEGEFSYSEGYEAPEVSGSYNGNFSFSDIDERADIYSIGAVIFEKIMGRVPDFSDQRNGKRWNFSNNPYFINSVPQLQNGITELFRKTLVRNKEKRYNSAEDLKIAFEKLIKLTCIDTFLKNQRISPCTPKDIYISRESVLSDIYNRLNEHHILYLYAIGGSGKSETTREYAEQYADKYDFIQSVFYSGSLKKTIANLDFVGMKAEDRYANTDEEINRLYDLKYDYLGNTSLYGTNTLLIIDNYDYNVDPTSEEYRQNYNVIQALKKLNIHIILTTRVKPKNSTECLDLEDMSPDELRALFFKINPKNKDVPERIALVNEIIKLSYTHTMTVKLVAMQSARYKRTLEEYLDVLKKNGLNSGIKGRITNEKDDESVTMTAVYDHIKALFDFNDLNDKQRYIMVNACLLPLEGLEANVFSEYIDLENFDYSYNSDDLDDSIVDLINSGWIALTDTENNRISKSSKITLHPMICDIVTNELKPELTDEKCRKFYVSFLDLIQEWGNNKVNGISYKEQENAVYALYKPMFSVFKNKNIREAINYILITYDGFYIKNHAVIYKGELKIYYGIKNSFILDKNITNIAPCDLDNLNPSTLEEIITNMASCDLDNLDPSIITEKSPYDFDNFSICKIIIQDGVSCINEDAFFSVCSLTEIEIPDSITWIGANAFSFCLSLKTIKIPDSVTKIGNGAFEGCLALTKAELSDNITEISEEMFSDCLALTTIKLPHSVTKIGDRAFSSCSMLTEIEIPDSVTEIGERAFSNCSALTIIIVPESVTKIGHGAFASCSALTQVVIPKRFDGILNSIFVNCSPSTKIIFSDNNSDEEQKNNVFLSEVVIDDNLTEIGDRMFYGNSSIEKIVVPKNITRIGNEAFSLCRNLKTIELPDSVTEIGSWAFAFCSTLTEVRIPNSVIGIGEKAFASCSALTQVVIPKRFDGILNSIFDNCPLSTKIKFSDDDSEEELIEYVVSSLFLSSDDSSEEELLNSFLSFDDNPEEKLRHYILSSDDNSEKESINYNLSSEIVIAENITEIEDGMFCFNTSIEKIIIPKNISRIGNVAFYHCKKLKILKIPDSVTEIGDWAFADCVALTEMRIPDSVTEIGERAFSGCKSLTNIELLSHITRIGIETFEGCSKLSGIDIPNSVTRIEGSAFYDCFSLSSIIIPNNVEYIDHEAFNNCSSLSTIIIPSSIIFLGDEAFFGCTALNRITILSHDVQLGKICIGYYRDDEGLYKKNTNLVIEGYTGSTAEQYAKENDFKFVTLG